MNANLTRWSVPIAALAVLAATWLFYGPVPAAFSAIIMGGVVYLANRAARIAGTPAVEIGEGFRGYFEIVGTAEVIPGHEQRDPSSGQPCAWYAIRSQRRKHRRPAERIMRSRPEEWTIVDRASSSQPFIVRDNTGTCRVLPERVSFEFAEPTRIFHSPKDHDLMHEVWAIKPGERVHVVGELRGDAEAGGVVMAAPSGGEPFALGARSPLESNEVAVEGSGVRIFVAILAIVSVLLAAGPRSERLNSSKTSATSPVPMAAAAQSTTAAAEANVSRAERWSSELARLRAARLQPATPAAALSAPQVPVAAASTPHPTPSPYYQEKLDKAQAKLERLRILESSGEHAPSGTVPDMITVIDEFNFTRVLNRTKNTLGVRVSRAGGRCRMYDATLPTRYNYRPPREGEPPVPVAPGQWQDFKMPKDECAQPQELPLDIELYSGDDIVWASDGILKRLTTAREGEVADYKKQLGLDSTGP